MQALLQHIQQGDIRHLSRAISLVENEAEGYEDLLKALPFGQGPYIIGITGAPGAGKSTLTDALISLLVEKNKRIGVLCIDPSSPFNHGALLGDRIRMSSWYTHPLVFIRSLASRGSMGGLSPKIIEITDLMKAAPFDYIIVETVGVGQTEIEIAGLADITVVVVVPEGGDEVQTMKAGLMEIADVFVVNKADRPGADEFIRNLRQMMAPAFYHKQNEVAILKTVAAQKEGIDVLLQKIEDHQAALTTSERRHWLLAEKAYQLIQQKKMKGVEKQEIKNRIATIAATEFNLYRFVLQYL